MKVGLFGFGAINRLVAKVLIKRGWEITSVVDRDPALIGNDVGEILGIDKIGVKVSNKVVVLKKSDIVIHATGSFLDKVFDQLINVIDLGKDIISTCETLAYPYYRYPDLAEKLHNKAVSRGVTVLGTGINPGFLLDTLIVVLSAPFDGIKKVRGIRSLDASKRRTSFKVKVGIGLTPNEFKERMAKGIITGHVGFAESVCLIASSMGVKLETVIEGQEPVITTSPVVINGKELSPGEVVGVRGYGIGKTGNEEKIRIEFLAYAGAPEFEEITIEGLEYSTTWRSTGIPGDIGTASVLVNLVESVMAFRPGLVTMADLVPFRPRLFI